MRQRLQLLLLVLIASSTFARDRAVTSDNRVKPGGATVSGIVSAVSGNLIQLAGGLVTIDATGARIVIDRGKDATLAQIEPGMLLFATLKNADVAANAPLPADVITVTRLSETTLFGPIQSVDPATSSFRLLGRTIHVTSETSFGGVHNLGEMLPNQMAVVQAANAAGKLVASSVLVTAPIRIDVHAARGTVKAIGADSWVISREKEGDLTLVVNAQTKIVGAPRVGDLVEVLYDVDSANANIAISIIKVEPRTTPPPVQVTLFRGKVKEIASTAWTITLASNEEVRLTINERTKIQPGISVGDTVEALAQKNDAGAWVALMIAKRP